MTKPITEACEEAILEIAGKHFDLVELNASNLDSVDFLDIHITSLRDALRDAYNAGYKAADKKK